MINQIIRQDEEGTLSIVTGREDEGVVELIAREMDVELDDFLTTLYEQRWTDPNELINDDSVTIFAKERGHFQKTDAGVVGYWWCDTQWTLTHPLVS